MCFIYLYYVQILNKNNMLSFFREGGKPKNSTPKSKGNPTPLNQTIK